MGQGPALSGVYLDASAAVKLLRPEPETLALERFLAAWPLRVSSELVRVELACVCHRHEIPASVAEELVAGLVMLPLTEDILRSACQRFSPPQRALGALHLASATQARRQLGCFVSYDADQLAAAAALGWRTEQPTPTPD